MATVSLASGNVPVSYMVLSGGKAGTDQTVALMSKLAMGIYGARSPKIRALAINILVATKTPQKQYDAELVAIHNWVRDHIRYVRDVHGQETLCPPEETALNSRAGDCDDHSILEAALLGSIGIPTRFKVIGVTPDRYSHVYLQGRIGNRWINLDPIMKDKPAGWEAPAHMRKTEKVYPENSIEGITMQRGVNGLGYVGDPRIVSHLEADPVSTTRTSGPYVRMNSFLDNNAPIEQLSNNAPAFPQNANVPQRMEAHLGQRRPKLIDRRQVPASAAARAQAEEDAYNAAEYAAMHPGQGMGDVMTPDMIAGMGAGEMDQKPRANMQRPPVAQAPEGIDVAFGRNALVMNGKRGDRIAYRGLWAMNEQPPISHIPVGVSGLDTGHRMMPGMGYLAGHSLSGPGIGDLADLSADAPAPIVPPARLPLKTLGWAALAVGIALYLRKK